MSAAADPEAREAQRVRYWLTPKGMAATGGLAEPTPRQAIAEEIQEIWGDTPVGREISDWLRSPA